MARCRVGVQIEPQGTTVDAMRDAWRAADELGVDSIWTWDHFFPIYGEADGAHFEAWTLLVAMACDTRRAQLGTLVTGAPYRNPDLLADMARTIDHLSGGRAAIGIGAGWFERDFREYGFEYGTPASRAARLEEALRRIRARRERLRPPPVGPLPLLVGGAGERVTLRLVAEHADMWNTFGPAERFAEKSRVLDEWCEKVGRDPAEIERTVLLQVGALDELDGVLEAGAQHVIVELAHPFDLGPVQQVLAAVG